MDYKNLLDEIKKKTLISIGTIIYPVIIIYVYYVFIGIDILEQRLLKSSVVLFEFLIFNSLVIYTILFYIRIYPADDVSTKDIFYPMFNETNTNNANFNIFFVERINKMIVSHRIVCNICGVLKPPRSHHCRKCNRCFLKMDHHCGLINVCIGWHNYKFFIIFLVLNIILSVFVIALLMVEAITIVEKRFFINYIVCFGIFGVVLIFNSVLLGYHIFLILNNETTIENIAINSYKNNMPTETRENTFQEGILAENNNEQILRGGSAGRDTFNPYNIGYYENFKEVFGNNPLYWFLPVFSSRGNGIDFPKNIKNEGDEFFSDIS